MENDSWSCLFSNDPSTKKRKRWTDGILVVLPDSNKVQLRDETNSQGLASGKVESGGAARKAGYNGKSGGASSNTVLQDLIEGEEIRVGRYTVQVGEIRSSSSSSSSSALLAAGVVAEGDNNQVFENRYGQRYQSRNIGVGNNNNNNNANSKTQTEQTQGQKQQQRQRFAAIGGGAGAALPIIRRGKFKPPARLNAGPPLGRHQHQHKQLADQARAPRLREQQGEPPLSSPLASSSLSSSLPLSPSPATLVSLEPQQQTVEHRQRPVAFVDSGGSGNSNSTSAVLPTPPANSFRPSQKLAPPLLPTRRRAFVAPSKATPVQSVPPSQPPPSALLPTKPGRGLTANRLPLGQREGRKASGGGGAAAAAAIALPSPVPAATRDENEDGNAMPPFKLCLRCGGGSVGKEGSSGHPASLEPHKQGQGQGQEFGGEQQGPGAGPPAKGGRGWPTRTVWVPNGFGGESAYRSVFCRAMQEELQLILDETVATRLERARAKIAAMSGSSSSCSGGGGGGAGGGGRSKAGGAASSNKGGWVVAGDDDDDDDDDSEEEERGGWSVVR